MKSNRNRYRLRCRSSVLEDFAHVHPPDSSAGWDEWLAAVQAFASARRILYLIDLTQDEESTHKAEPTEPSYDGAVPLTPTVQNADGIASQATVQNESTPLTMTAEQKEAYKLIYQWYKDKLAVFEREQKAIQDLVDYIYTIVSRSNLIEIQERKIQWELLTALKRRLASSEYARKIEIPRH